MLEEAFKDMNEKICLTQYITQKEYEELSKLQSLCTTSDKINLKLELDYKLNRKRNTEEKMKEINEILYYIDDEVVAYIGISSFGGKNIAEINGMTHPEHRRKGIFRRIFDLAMEECSKRGFSEILLLTDGKSVSGIKFIEGILGEYVFSEYRMKRAGKVALEEQKLCLRKAINLDAKELIRQDSIYFNQEPPLEYECLPEEEEERGKFTYLSEVDGVVVGKLNVSYEKEAPAFISGVGILPEYRGRGYGKASLKEAIRLIHEKGTFEVELDVETKNSNALNLYKSCGFEEQSVMNYYRSLKRK